MRKLLKQLLKKYLMGLQCSSLRKHYAYVLSINNIAPPPTHTRRDEQKWLDYWRPLGVDPLKETFRAFYPYMGASLRIVPATTCQQVIEPILNPVKMRGYYADKNFFEKILPADFCPIAVIRKIQGQYFDVNYHFIEMNEDVLADILSKTDFARLIVKPSIDSNSGNGVEMFVKNSEGIFCSVKSGTQLSYEWLEDNAGSNFILQEAVEQSDFMARFCATSVNTFRIAVYRSVKDEQCYVVGTVMKIGTDGSFVDNAHGGGRYVGISQDGEVSHYTLDQYGVKQDIFNGIDFSKETFIIPNLDKIRAFSTEVAKHIPHHRLIALDVAIRKDGTPVLIEYNITGYAMWIFQYTGFSAFGDFVSEIRDYALKHRTEIVQAIYF